MSGFAVAAKMSKNAADMLLTTIGILLGGIWMYALIYMHRATVTTPILLREISTLPNDDPRYPLLSVIVPACNEAEHLAAALRSLLAQNYPRLEIIVVDDRSIDRTGAIIDGLAATDSRIRAIHIESLPDGWLGKVHALHCAVQQARGDWYLFTDADVRFAQGTLRGAVRYARAFRLNHLTCVPEIDAASLWLDVAIRSFFLVFSVTARLAGINRYGSRRSVGIGAFNLVEADMFNRSPGFEWLKMEPADDLGVGLMMNRAGARTHLVNGNGLINVAWYHSLRGLIRGLEKNSFGPAARYSYARQAAIVFFLWCLVAAPPICLIVGLKNNDAILLATAGATLLVSLGVACAMPRNTAREIIAYLALPLGILLISWVMIRSAYLCLRNDGIDWRGTHYSLSQLREGQRVKL